MLAIRTILHPTDFSDSSDYAFRLACSLARDYGAKLVVLHVAPAPVAFAAEGVLMQPPEYDPEPLREELNRIQPTEAGIEMEHLLVQGDAAPEILQTATDTQCDVIVLGTHGRTGLSRLLMGSVAEQIVREAGCPVLTVRSMPKRVLADTNAAVKAEPLVAGGV